jgi:hypothetical protein
MVGFLSSIKVIRTSSPYRPGTIFICSPWLADEYELNFFDGSLLGRSSAVTVQRVGESDVTSAFMMGNRHPPKVWMTKPFSQGRSPILFCNRETVSSYRRVSVWLSSEFYRLVLWAIALKMEAASTFETSVNCHATRLCSPEGSHLRHRRCDKVKSYVVNDNSDSQDPYAKSSTIGNKRILSSPSRTEVFSSRGTQLLQWVCYSMCFWVATHSSSDISRRHRVQTGPEAYPLFCWLDSTDRPGVNCRSLLSFLLRNL